MPKQSLHPILLHTIPEDPSQRDDVKRIARRIAHLNPGKILFPSLPRSRHPHAVELETIVARHPGRMRFPTQAGNSRCWAVVLKAGRVYIISGRCKGAGKASCMQAQSV